MLKSFLFEMNVTDNPLPRFSKKIKKTENAKMQNQNGNMAANFTEIRRVGDLEDGGQHLVMPCRSF